MRDTLKIINKKIFWIILFCSPNILAKVSMDFDITAQMKVETLYSYTKRPRIRCNRVDSSTKGPYVKGPFYPQVKFSGSTEKTQDFYTELFVNLTDGAQRKVNEKYVKKVRYLKANIAIDEQRSFETASIKVNFSEERPFDPQNGKVKFRHRAKCVAHRWSSAISDPLMAGQININYKVPKDVWLIEIKVNKSTGLFEYSNIDTSDGHRGFKKSLNPFIDNGSREVMYVWVKPGSTITKSFVYGRDLRNTHLSILGDFEVSFKPVESTSMNITQFKNWLSLYDRTYAWLQAESLNDGFGDDKFTDFVSSHLAVIKNPSLVKDIISSFSIYELESLFDSLGKSRDYVNLSESQSHIRIASTILSYKIAEAYVSKLVAFCEDSKLKLQYKNIDLNLNWLEVTNYLISKASGRLKNYNIKSISALINVMYDYQSRNLTYAEVRNNPIEYKKMLKAYQIFSTSMDLRSLPIEKSYKEIKYLLDNLKNKSASLKNANLILSSAKELSLQEEELVSEILNKMRLFQPNKSDKINLNSLKDKASRFESHLYQLSDIIDASSEIFTVNGSGLQKMNEMILNLGINYISLFEIPFKSDFELFRKEFFDLEKIKQVKEKLLLCLGNENND